MAWGFVVSAGIGLVGSYMSSQNSGGGGSGGGQYDPYAQYRPQAAQQLQALQANPGSAASTPYGVAMSQAASRAMASQGYTGSGNAVVAAANAGGQAYQQDFNNLVVLSGAGQNPAQAQQVANQQAQYNQNQQNQMWGQLGGMAKSVVNNYTSSSNPPANDSGSTSTLTNMDYFNSNGGTSSYSLSNNPGVG